MAAVGHANGDVELFYVSRAARLARAESSTGGIETLTLAPRDDLIVLRFGDERQQRRGELGQGNLF